jgi:hypothetical protein
MGLLNSILEWLVAFGAGFFGHVVAHDFCEVTPMISRKIIEAAASRLPASIRERYREEWRADLQAQSGALAKLAWSLGCFRSAWRLRREASIDRSRRTTFNFVLNNGETLTLDVPTTAAFVTAVSLVRRRWLHRVPTALGALTILIKLLRCCVDEKRTPREMMQCVDGVPGEKTVFDLNNFGH